MFCCGLSRLGFHFSSFSNLCRRFFFCVLLILVERSAFPLTLSTSVTFTRLLSYSHYLENHCCSSSSLDDSRHIELMTLLLYKHNMCINNSNLHCIIYFLTLFIIILSNNNNRFLKFIVCVPERYDLQMAVSIFFFFFFKYNNKRAVCNIM